MPVYCKFFREKQIVLRGPITKDPYKGWFELDSANWGDRNSASSRATGGSHERLQQALLTEVSITTRFHDIVSFAVSQSGSGSFSVQLDFVHGDAPAYLTLKLDEAQLSSVSVSAAAEGVGTVFATLSATRVEYVYIGAANKGSPSVTVKKKGS